VSPSWLRMELSPLASRDFRVLFGSGTVTLLGTEATDVCRRPGLPGPARLHPLPGPGLPYRNYSG
jgi:hypothetical protein